MATRCKLCIREECHESAAFDAMMKASASVSRTLEWAALEKAVTDSGHAHQAWKAERAACVAAHAAIVERYRQASTFNGALYGTYFTRKKIQRAVNAALACVPAVMAVRRNAMDMEGNLQTRGDKMSGGSFGYLCDKDLTEYSGSVDAMSDYLRSNGYEDVAQLTGQIVTKMKEIDLLQSILKEVWKCAEWVDSCDWLPEELANAVTEFRAQLQQPTRPFVSLAFTYEDDIGQIGEHDVFFGGVELTQDIGEFKAGQRFASASIDFQAGHLTFSTSAGREHRYDFELKVGAKHEGHTCTGCGSVVGQPCRQHA